jgi:hypothetical protein
MLINYRSQYFLPTYLVHVIKFMNIVEIQFLKMAYFDSFEVDKNLTYTVVVFDIHEYCCRDCCQNTAFDVDGIFLGCFE